ncbi:hypothetical protein BGX31_009446 [Mortierella sp. GBA43]|nr:hypothetical protein BGX31_009446 [Mortierella sp. GBA43]
MSRAWSPPLDVRTRTLTTLSVVRARPEHLKAIHEIQVLAYPGMTDFHERPEVFQSKLEGYPAGNFIALATTSVVTDDDTLTWCHKDHDHDEHDDDDDDTRMITETAPDGSTTTTTSTTLDSGETHINIVRARTPDIWEGDDDDDVNYPAASSSSSSGLQPGSSTTHHSGHKHHHHHHHHHLHGADHDEDDHHTTVLFQWEEPVGYLFSQPYKPGTVKLHLIADPTASTPEAKRMRLDDEGEDEDDFEHDQLMEKYYIHDCAVHPAWRGKGLAAKLFKALEESLTPSRTGSHSADTNTDRGDLVDTEEEEDTDEDHDEAATSSSSHHHHSRHRRKGGRGSKAQQRKGAPNLKEIVLVSVLGTRPFWERTGGFQVVKDHDIDLSSYGDTAVWMSRPFTF